MNSENKITKIVGLFGGDDVIYPDKNGKCKYFFGDMVLEFDLVTKKDKNKK